MRVLLTGASGFIGSQVLDLLCERGYEVHAAARHPGEGRPGVVWHPADLLAPDAAETLARDAQASHLLHLAWYAVPGRFWNAADNERWIDATLRLLRAFGQTGGSRAVMAGTCAEYEWGAELLSEHDTPLRPATLYGACKHATHVAAEAVAAQLGVSLAWGRVFFLYGPGEPAGRLVSSVASGLLAGDEVPTTDGEQRRDFMHVRDVAEAFVTLLESDVRGAVNIATGHPTSIREIVTLIAKYSGAPERVRFGALPQRPNEPMTLAGATRRLTAEVGFTPSIEIEQGIADVVAWWQAK